MSSYNVPTEATQLLHRLISDRRLMLPKQVVDIASNVHFSGENMTFLRKLFICFSQAPLKLTGPFYSCPMEDDRSYMRPQGSGGRLCRAHS